MKMLTLLFTLLITPAIASPVTATLNENQRLFRNTGIFTLQDPYTGELLGEYQFATGGYGQGSAPFGVYVIGDFQGTDDDPLNIGPRWLIHNPGLDQGEAEDPGIEGQTKPRRRTELELHRAKATNGTLGCLAILGGPEVYAQFMAQLKYILEAGPVQFTLAANPNGATTSGELEAYYPHIQKRSVRRAHSRKQYNRKHAHAKPLHTRHTGHPVGSKHHAGRSVARHGR